MKKILIIRFSALGDVAMLVPVVRALATQYPKLGIGVLSTPKMAPLFNGMPKNVRFLSADIRHFHGGVKGLKHLMEDIHISQFDALADMHRVIRTQVFRLYFRVKNKKVAVVQKGRMDRFLHLHNFRSTPVIPMIQRYMDVLNRLGLPIQLTSNELDIQTPKQGLGIAPFAAHDGKIYPPKRMEAIIKHFSQQGIPIYLFGGGHRETAILNAWAQKYPNVTCTASRYTLSQEMAIMQQVQVMVTMDSANMHLASLVGTRVISIWGATDPTMGFLGFGQHIEDCICQSNLKCRPCSVYGAKECKYHDYHCLDIDPQVVIQKIEQALQ